MDTKYVSMEFDAKQMIRLLGNDLYDSPLAMLRENIQNAYDAILERKRIVSEFYPKIEINISDREVNIRDNGIGMNSDILANNYWKAGNSSKNNKESIEAGVVGHFGIGALANFGVCTKLEIKTRRYGEMSGYYTEAIRDNLNVKDSIPIREEKESDFEYGTNIVATLETPNSISLQNAIEYLKPYIEYLEIPVYINGEIFPTKSTSFQPRKQGLDIRDGFVSYTMDVQYGNSIPMQVKLKIYNITYFDTKLRGYIYLDSSENSIMGLRNGFGLARINISTIYNFGGVANLDTLTPTAGREAVSRESSSVVAYIMRSIEKQWTGIISSEPVCDNYSEFITYVSNNYDDMLASNIKIKLANEDRSIKLSEINIENASRYRFADSVDSTVLAKFKNSNECVLSISDKSNRKRIQRNYLNNMGVKSIPNEIQVIKEYSDKELTNDQFFILSELRTIVEEDYYIKDFDIKFADISHLITVFVDSNCARNQFCIYISPESPDIKHLINVRNDNYRLFTPIAKDLVRTVLYPQFSTFMPKGVKERTDYITRVIQSRKDEYIIPYEMYGSMDELLEQLRNNKISSEEFIRLAKSERNKHQQTINQSQIGDVADVLTSISDPVISSSESVKKSIECAETIAMPPILCLDVDTKLRILKTDESNPVLHNNRMFMALTDRMVNNKRIFFTNPHTTRVIWSMHRLIYIFTDLLNRYTLYYDLELTQKIPNTTGGRTIPSTTIITKDKIFVPIVEELYNYFNLDIDSRLKFYVHFDDIENND
ncbi:MAG: ATP-binding protein [Muribaculum sp.]|nr:ATP-binding protein [Muribaculum sp.]